MHRSENLFQKRLFVLISIFITAKLKVFEEVKGLVKVVKKVSQSTTRASFSEPIWWVTSSRGLSYFSQQYP